MATMESTFLYSFVRALAPPLGELLSVSEAEDVYKRQISNTQTINPEALGHSEGERVENLVQVLDVYKRQGVVGKDLVQLLAGLVAVGGAGLLRHLDAAVGHESTLEGLVGLQAHDLLLSLIHISCWAASVPSPVP